MCKVVFIHTDIDVRIRCHWYHIDNVLLFPCCFCNFDPSFRDAPCNQQISDRLELLSLNHDFLSSPFSWKSMYGG